VPTKGYVVVGFRKVDVLPLPKSHEYVAIPLGSLIESVGLNVKGIQPPAGRLLMVTTGVNIFIYWLFVIVLIHPAALVTVRVTLNKPDVV